MTDIFDSVVLITSTDEKNKKFGSGFAFRRKQDETWILTCAHVVEDVGGEEHIQVGGKNAKVLACGKPHEVDMAVLEVTDLDIPPLKLGSVGVQNLECMIIGFAPLTSRNQTRKAERVHGKLGSQVKFETREGVRIEAWRLWIDSKVLLEGGYSGSPVLESASKTVFAVTSHSSHEGDTGYAVSLTNLPRIWPAMPADLVQEKPPEVPKPEYMPDLNIPPYMVNRHEQDRALNKLIAPHSEMKGDAEHETPVLLQSESRQNEAPTESTDKDFALETSSPTSLPVVVVPGPGAYRHCDRDDQDNDFRGFFEDYSRDAPGEPQFYLLHGEAGECHDSFVQRLCDTHIKRYAERIFSAQRADVFTLPVKWCDRELKLAERDLKYNLSTALREKINASLEAATLADSLVQLLRLRPNGVVVVSHNLAARNWKKYTPEVLKFYCRAYRQAYRRAKQNNIPLAHCVVFFNLIYPPPEQLRTLHWWERRRYAPKRIEKQVCTWQQSQEKEGYLCQIVGKLTPVTREEVWDCITRLIEQEHERLKQLDRIFGSAPSVRMALVEKAVQSLIEERESAAL